MKGSEAKIVSYMEGANKRFIIPVYQRNYDWKTENCKQLYDDLIRVIRNDRSSHFFGSIVSANNDGFCEYLIIDGQQRLTTISLLMLAMYNLIQKEVLQAKQRSLGEKILESYLIDKWQDGDARFKLQPIKKDREAYVRLFGDETEYIHSSNLTINYEYFYNRIQKEEISLDQLYDALTRLEIINIILNHDDNPQLIFESLNSTGMALKEGDKIRNFILMGLDVKKQNEYYEKYWSKIEACVGDVSSFVRDYLSVKQQAIPSISKVYLVFKAFVEDNPMDTEALLKDLLNYARWYEILLHGSHTNNALNGCIYRLNRLETTVTRPFFLEVLRLHSEGMLNLSDVTDIFLCTESYLFRRTICDLPTNALNKIFLMLNREIMRFDGTANNYVAKFKTALCLKSDRGRFPDDTEFAEAFSTRPIYQMNGKNKVYVLERMENSDTVEDKSIYSHIDDGTYTIEHVMPQHLTPAWMRELGEDYETIHETWLHRIANLTLTGYNSKYSNSPFAEKRDMEHGFHASGLRLNSWIAQRKHWGLAELEQRNQLMIQCALKTWPRPEVEFQPVGKQFESCTLDDEVDLSGREIVRFTYKNAEQPVMSWIDMFEKVLRILHTEDRAVLTGIAYGANGKEDLRPYVSNKPENLRTPLKLDDGIFVEKNTSTTMKISILRRFFKVYDVDPEDLVFYLKDSSEPKEVKELVRRYQLRLCYWEKALPIIQKAQNNQSDCFANVAPSKENWISGFFGIAGFQITCYANFNSAKVELNLSNQNVECNKKAFDYLFTKRGQIETQLGKILTWNRGEETKRSSVSYTLNGVSIENEADWTQMAHFHAEWSRKFYDVFVPLLKQRF